MARPQLLVGSVLMFAACASNTHRIEAGPMFLRPRGDVAIQNAGGTLSLADGTMLSSLDLESTGATPYVSYSTFDDVHRYRVRGFQFENYGGSGPLPQALGDLTTGSPVRSEIDSVAVTASYTREMDRCEEYFWGLGAALSYTQIDYNFSNSASPSGVPFEHLEVDVTMPMPYAEGEMYFGDLTLAANVGLMPLNINDVNGFVVDIEAQARWRVLAELELMTGYRYLSVGAKGTAEGRRYETDLELNGLFLGAILRF